MPVPALLVVATIAVLAPLVVELTPGRLLPVVVAEIVLGIVVGPLLGIVDVTPLLDELATFGLGFLFFLAGLEIDLRRVAGRPLALAAAGWGLSVVLAFLIAWSLDVAGLHVPVALLAAALCTTSLGAVLPILRDSGLLATQLGALVVAAGLCGELLPLAFSRSLSPAPPAGAVAVVAAAVLVVGAVIAVQRRRPPRLLALLDRTMHASSQLPVRLCLLFLVALASVSDTAGLDVIVGAFVAGIVIGVARTADERGTTVLEHKLEAIGYGFLVPIFFVVTGLRFDLGGLATDRGALLLVPVFLVAILAVRGLPALLYRRELPPRQCVAFALLSATALPLVVAITTIAVDRGAMPSETAAAMVSAAMLSVLLFPVAARAVLAGSAPAVEAGPRSRRLATVGA